MLTHAKTDETAIESLETSATIALQDLERAENRLATSDRQLTTQELADFFDQRVKTNQALIDLYQERGMKEYAIDTAAGTLDATPMGKAMHEIEWLQTFAIQLRSCASLEEFKLKTTNSKDVAEELYIARSHVKHIETTAETQHLENAIANLIGEDAWERILKREKENPGRAYLEPQAFFYLEK